MSKENKIYRKPNMQLYVNSNTDGAIDPPLEIAEAMSTIDSMIEDEYVDDYENGMYFAIMEILSTPIASLQAKVLQMLNEIIEVGVGNSLTDITDDIKENDMHMVERNEPVITTLDEEGNEIPMTEAQLATWYNGTPGVFITDFHRSDHAGKWRLYQKYLKEKEQEDRDLTDEEMLAELPEVAEQAD